ncbi:CpxP family protein [Photobacterium nomapromontoriensis]|uniref:CpxP family protein n=1 Tax=Photobacterium nomapromontoriensis TaxID=2910237 RepID=UPI003D1355A3
MTSFKKTLALVIALPLALGSASALAYGGGKQHHDQGGKNSCGMKSGHAMFRGLDLTDTQKKEMKALRQANRDTMRSEIASHHAEMQAQHQKIQQLVLADNFDESAVRALAEQMTEQQVDRRVSMLKQRHDMLQILTPDQKVKYQQLQAERSEQCQARMAEKHNN